MNSNKSKMNMTNQEKLDEMYDVIQDLRYNIDDIHGTLDWIKRRETIKLTFTVIYWLLILGIVFGAYYYIQPLLGGLMIGLTGSLDTLQSFEKTVGGLPDLSNLKKILEAIGAASSTK